MPSHSTQSARAQPSLATRRLRAGALAALCAALLAPAAALAQSGALWWTGFIDTRGKAFLELPDSPRLCAMAREALRRAPAEAGRALTLPVKVETLLPPGARLSFGITDVNGAASERVFTRVVTLTRGEDKGACAHLAEAGADTPGSAVEEDRLAFGVHPPRPAPFRAPRDDWKSYGAASTKAVDARFGAAADAPSHWRSRVGTMIAAPADVFGQRFDAIIEAGAPARPFGLIGAIANDVPGATYNTLNLIVPDAPDDSALPPSAAPPLFRAGPSGGIERDRAASYVAQVAGTIDLDGDGIDELVLRARYYNGGNLKILKYIRGAWQEIRQSAYEGE